MDISHAFHPGQCDRGTRCGRFGRAGLHEPGDSGPDWLLHPSKEIKLIASNVEDPAVLDQLSALGFDGFQATQAIGHPDPGRVGYNTRIAR